MNPPWIPLRFGAVTGSASRSLSGALSAVLATWTEHGRIDAGRPIKAGRVWRVGDCAIKVYPAQRGWIERLRASPARRSAQLAARIAPVQSPAPLCFLERPRGGESLLASEFIDGDFLHMLWGRDAAAIAAFPAFVASMHAARVFHGDLHAGNMLWDGRAWYLLDLDGVRQPLRTLLARRLVFDHWGRLHFAVARAPGMRALFDQYLELRGLRWDRDAAWREVERASERVARIRQRSAT